MIKRKSFQSKRLFLPFLDRIMQTLDRRVGSEEG